MKTTRFLLLALPMALLLGCGPQMPDRSTPENTFAAMVKAIHAKDIAAYEQCWHSNKAANEGLVAGLKLQPEMWEALQRSFPANSSPFGRRETEENGKKFVVFDVAVSNGAGSLDTSSVSLTQEDNLWKMWHW